MKTLDLYVNTSSPTVSNALVAGFAVLSKPADAEFVVRTQELLVRIHPMTVTAGSRTGVTTDVWGETPTIKYGGKVKEDYATSETVLFFSETFTLDDTNANDLFYSSVVNLNTDEFIEAFTGGATKIAIKHEIEVDGDTVVQADGYGLLDVLRGGEGLPTPAVPPYPLAPLPDHILGGATGPVWKQYSPNELSALLGLLALTSLTGGGAGSLDALPTVDEALHNGTIREVLTGSVGGGDLAVSRWVLMAGTNAEDGISYVRPDDYDAEINARVWVRIG